MKKFLPPVSEINKDCLIQQCKDQIKNNNKLLRNKKLTKTFRTAIVEDSAEQKEKINFLKGFFMTNEEIRKQVPIQTDDLGNGKELITAGYDDLETIQELTRNDEAEQWKSKLMAIEYELAETAKYIDGLIEQKVVEERDRVAAEIRKFCEPYHGKDVNHWIIFSLLPKIKEIEGSENNMFLRGIHDAFEEGFHAGHLWAKEPDQYPHKGIAVKEYIKQLYSNDKK